ncbi:hypothetical protein AGMMS50276_28660 [Synergistales bacterium]|nr:hypothetical protein AGMMS50276_28660 [Synergistales bacterium]
MISAYELYDKVETLSTETICNFKRMSEGRLLAVFTARAAGVTAASILESAGHDVDCYFDNNPELMGSIINGKPIKNPAELENGKYAVLIASSPQNCSQISEQLNKLNAPHMSYDSWSVARHFEEYKKVLLYLNDEYSKCAYLSCIYYLLTHSFANDFYERNQYFGVPEFAMLVNDVVVDCGAFVGDSVEDYIKNSSSSIRRIYAFEPFDRNFDAMKIRVERLKREWALDDGKIVLVKVGIGAKTGKVRLSGIVSTYRKSVDGVNGIEMDVFSIDDYFKGENIAPTVIKADIEGMEQDMLRGAERTIKQNQPKLAISIYHSAEDLFEIAGYIKYIVPNYRFAVRKHCPGCDDTILYAWI